MISKLYRRSRLGGAALVFAAMATATQAIMPADAATRGQIRDLVIQEAERNPTVPTSLALAVARVESNFDEDALSSAGARGVMQIMPATAKGEFGADPDQLWQPRTNIRLGVLFLERLYKQYGNNWERALSHYNGGTLRGHGANARPHTYTRDYVRSVIAWNTRYAEQSTRTKLASAADTARHEQQASAGNGEKLTEHPPEYWVFNDPDIDGDWREQLEKADYWLASPKERAKMRERLQAQRKQRFQGSRASTRIPDDADTTYRRNDGRDADRGDQRNPAGHGRYEPVSGDETVNRFERVSPRVKELRRKFQSYLRNG